jgi:hypothetical protein
MIGLESRVDSALAPGYTLGTVRHVTAGGRFRVEWDDGTNSSHPPAELVEIGADEESRRALLMTDDEVRERRANPSAALEREIENAEREVEFGLDAVDRAQREVARTTARVRELRRRLVKVQTTRPGPSS